MPQHLTPFASWSLFRKIFTRFSITYFLLYYVSNFNGWQFIWDTPVTLAGKWLISRDFEIAVWPNGSGDTTYNYLQLFCMVLLSLLITVTWSLADRQRKNYERLLYAAMVFIRYNLALVMITYGMFKILKTQFPFPPLVKLDQLLGDTSPMGLAWSYMGYSTGYNLFAGLAEFIGGFLLFFRRTTLLGALCCMTVMLNVVAMNFCYDIPVKLFSMHLFFTALFLALPDLQRLIYFFILNKPVAAATHWAPVFTSRWKHIIFICLKYLVVTTLLWRSMRPQISKYRETNTDTKQIPLYGIYEVERVTADSTGAPGSIINNFRFWKKLYIDKNDSMIARRTDNDLQRFSMKTDTVHHTLSYWNPNTERLELHYQVTGKDILLLYGSIGTNRIQIQLRKKNPDDFRLINTGFHWINEYPLNR